MTDPGVVLTSSSVFTMTDGAPPASLAVRLAGARIQDVAPAEGIAALSAAAAVQDYGSRSILPGFIDPHAHMEMTAVSLHNTVDCHSPPCETIDDILSTLADNMDLAERNGGWLVGQGSLFQDRKLREGRLPTRADLDRVTADTPIALKAGGHTLVLNTAALRSLEIGANYAAPNKALVETDQFGEPTGVLREMNQLLPIPKPKGTDLLSGIAETIGRHFLANGITSVGEIPETVEGYECLEQLARAKMLPVRTAAYVWVPSMMPIQAALGWHETRPSGVPPDYLHVRGVKLFTDGGFSAALAAVKRPYRINRNSRGRLTYSRSELRAAYRGALNAGLQMIVHANGERAQAVFCAAVRSVHDEGLPPPTSPTRIEHGGNFVSDLATLDAWRAAEIVPVSQPSFLYTFGDYFPHYLGRYAERGRFPYRTLLDHGWMPSASSDASGSELRHSNPFFSIWCAVKRQSFTGSILERQESVSVLEALAMHTIYAAQAMGQSELKGSLEVGKFADLVVLDRDLTSVDVDDLKDVRVDYVFVDGRLAYERPGAQPPRTVAANDQAGHWRPMRGGKL